MSQAVRRRFGRGTATVAIGCRFGAHSGAQTALDRQQFAVR